MNIGTPELLVLLPIALFIVIPIWGIIAAAKDGQAGWAIAIGVTLPLVVVSLVLTLIYLANIRPKSANGLEPAYAATPASTYQTGWYPDPASRYQIRYWDGTAWTERVANDGVEVEPPPESSPAATGPPIYVSLEPRIVSIGGRLGGWLVNIILMIATLYIGWIIWAIVLAFQKQGQTPAKKILGHRVIIEDTGESAGVLRMFFARGVLPAIVMPIAFSLLFIPGVILLFLPFFGNRCKTVWEHLSETIVVYEAG